MNSKSTWVWASAALALFAFIFFYQQHLGKRPVGPQKLLPSLKADAVTSVEILPLGQRKIRAERVNDTWQLVEPLSYPAQATEIQVLLHALEQLTSTTYITEQELRTHERPDEEFGIEPAQTSLILQQGGHRTQIHVGYRTPPGNQVYLHIVTVTGIYVVDADWLQAIPRTGNDWRATGLVDLSRLRFDRLMVTKAGNTLELQRDPDSRLWGMVLPLKARADSGKVEEALRGLQDLRVHQFVSDRARPDLESFGLETPELSVALAQGSNVVFALDFGKTNGADLVYARQHDQNTIVTVDNARVGPWRASYEAFRDRHLVALTGRLDAIEVRVPDGFTLRRQASNSWSVLPEDFPADPGLIDELAGHLSGLEVSFAKDSVTELELPKFGLAPPARQYILNFAAADREGTNATPVQLDFGADQEGNVFAKRDGESFVYAIKAADFARLPTAGWQLRDRRIWKFTEEDVASVTLQQEGKTRQFLRRGPKRWSFGAGTQGIMDEVMSEAIEETVHRLGDLTAAAWAGRGEDKRGQFGFTTGTLQLSIELRNGEKRTVEFGGQAPSGLPCAMVSLEGNPWFFEFPVAVYQYVQFHLLVPANL